MNATTKRKERDDGDDVQNHGSTLFVSNVPFTATSTDLQTLFSDIAPVRSAFIVLDKEKKVSKGVGYVGFALKEDAERAFAIVQQGETVIEGRILRCEWAGKNKNVDQDLPQAKKPRQAKVPSAFKASTADPNAIRTIVLSGLPESVTSQQLWKKMRKYPGAESIIWPIEGEPSTAHAIFNTISNAISAVGKLHAHTYKGVLLSVALKKKVDGLLKSKGKALASDGQSPTRTKAPSRSSRLIVRNLPWNITEHTLRSLFLPYGPIHSVTIPTSSSLENDTVSDEPSTKGRSKSKGFAFVWFLSRKDAETAIQKVNGTMVNSSSNASGGKLAEAGKEGDGSGRVIAVDWALSKERWEAEKKALEINEKLSKDEGQDHGMGDGSDESNEEDETQVGDDEPESGSDSDNSQSNSNGQSDDDEDDEEPKSRPTLPTPADGTTLFVRNVSFDATEEDLRSLFKSHGPLRYARLTIDSSTNPPRPRGTGFVCFWNKEDAEKVLRLAENVKELSVGTGVGSNSQKRANPFTMPTLLAPDPSSQLAQSLVLHGRTLDVVRAVERGEAGKLYEEGVRQRRKEDKRSIYLLREGVIFPNSPAAHGLTALELDSRIASFNTRRTLLNSNPSLYVSKTRLSIRQLPRWVDEKLLKRLALHAIGAFEQDVKEGKRECLSPDELATGAGDENESTEKSKELSKKAKKSKTRYVVVQSKVMRDSAKVDLLSGKGKGRSKGFAFLELSRHADALRVLRWCNNNPDIEVLARGWWKEELQSDVKGLEGKPTKNDEVNERLKVMKAKLKDFEDDASTSVKPKLHGKYLIVEFSIENIQVVKRRAEKIAGEEKMKQRPLKRKSMLDGTFSRDAHPTNSEQPLRSNNRFKESKRLSGSEQTTTRTPRMEQRKERKKLSETVDEVKKKVGSSFGSLIGRKRKERKDKVNRKA